MPVYYAKKRAEEEEAQFQDDLFMLHATIDQFLTLYPYAHIEMRMHVDGDEMAAHFQRKYTYGTNLTFRKPES